MADDLRPEANVLQRLFERFRDESNAVAIAKVSVVVALLSLLMAFMALDNAKDAKMRAEYQDLHIEELSDKIGVMEVYITNHKAEDHE